MDFAALLRPTPRTAVFGMEGWHVWGASPVRTPDGVYHLLFARWREELGHNAWVTHSEIGHAAADGPLGPYTFHGVALPGAGGDAWDAEVTHNPTVIEADGKYYLYYMGTRGPGGWWDYRNRQRIGVAVADHPAGPWQRFDRPVLDVTPGSWDALLTSNPSCCRLPSGRFLLVHKGVAEGPRPKGGAVLSGAAWSDSPLGPFTKLPEPIVVNPEHPWAVEDPFVWWQDGSCWMLLKDFQGTFARAERNVLALFQSSDGEHWRPADQPLASRREILWDDGEVEPVGRLERPQLWLEQGRPAVLFAACERRPGERCFNVHLPLG